MKKYLGWAILALILSLGGYYSATVIAQGPGGPAYAPPMGAAGPKTVLIDVNYIFKNHERFKAMMGDMKNDIKQAEDTVNADKAKIVQLERNRDECQKGTIDYKNFDEEATRAKANLAVKIQGQRNDFLQREAQIYNAVYQEILQATNYYCMQNGVRHGAAVQRRCGRFAKSPKRAVVHQSAGGVVPTLHQHHPEHPGRLEPHPGEQPRPRRPGLEPAAGAVRREP